MKAGCSSSVSSELLLEEQHPSDASCRQHKAVFPSVNSMNAFFTCSLFPTPAAVLPLAEFQGRLFEGCIHINHPARFSPRLHTSWEPRLGCISSSALLLPQRPLGEESSLVASGAADCPVKSYSFAPLVPLICLRSFYVFIKLVLKFKKQNKICFYSDLTVCKNIGSFTTQKKSKVLP